MSLANPSIERPCAADLNYTSAASLQLQGFLINSVKVTK